MSDNLVLGRHCPNDGFRSVIANTIDVYADQASRAIGDSMFLARHVGALRELAGYIRACAASDQRIYALWLMSAQRGDSDHFNLGEYQTRFLADVGLTSDPPAPSDALEELIAVGVGDLSQPNTGLVERAEFAERKAGELAEAAARTTELEARVNALTTANVELELENEALASDRAHLRLLVEDRNSEKPRREKVEGHTGIYRNRRQDGDRLEITWTIEGKSHTKVLPKNTTLEDAVAAREEKLAKEPAHA